LPNYSNAYPQRGKSSSGGIGQRLSPEKKAYDGKRSRRRSQRSERQFLAARMKIALHGLSSSRTFSPAAAPSAGFPSVGPSRTSP